MSFSVVRRRCYTGTRAGSGPVAVEGSDPIAVSRGSIMRQSRSTAPAALGAALATLVAAAASGQALERVVYVSVYHAATYAPPNEPLEPRHLAIREDGVEREILRVAPAAGPMPVAVLVDNSAASTPALADLRAALTAFVREAQALGPIAIISVADRPTILADYTTVPHTLATAIGRVFAVPGSGATLLEGILETARGLARREADRAAIVLLAAEHVEFSELHHTQVLEALQRSGAALHAVVWTNPAASIADEPARNRATVLDRGVRESGGLRLDVLTSQAYESRMRQLGGVLARQYRVVYARPQTLIPPRRVEVTTTLPGFEARATPARGQKGG